MIDQVIPPGWRGFEAQRTRLTIAVPPTWSEVTNPDTVVSLASADYLGLIEVFRFLGGQSGNLADFVAQAHVDITPFEAGYRNGRVLRHSPDTLEPGVRIHRVGVTYEEHGRKMEVRYLVVGVAEDAVQVALKSHADRIRFYNDDFERMAASLRTDWLPNGPTR